MNATSDQMTISVVVVTRNRREYLLACLESLRCQTYQVFDVTVIDNGSSDGTPSMVRNDYPECTLIALDRNLGAPGARNVGILSTTGEILFFPDDDSTLAPDVLEIIAGEMLSEPELGAVVSSIREERRWLIRPRESDSGKRIYLPYFQGLCALRRAALDQVGLYPSDFGYGAEELDLSLRMLAAGYRIVFQPRAQVEHYRTGTARPRGQRLRAARNELRVIWKYAPPLPALIWTLDKVVKMVRQGLQQGNVYYLVTELLWLPLFLRRSLRVRSRLDWKVFAMQEYLERNSISTLGYLERAEADIPSFWQVMMTRCKQYLLPGN